MNRCDARDCVALLESKAGEEPPPDTRTYWRAAVLGCDEPGNDCLTPALTQAGGVVMRFARIDQLVRALWEGEKFDVVLASFRGDGTDTHMGARILRLTLRDSTPLVLLAHPEQLAGNASLANELAVHVIPLPCQGSELARLVGTTLLRSPLHFGRYLFVPQRHCVLVDHSAVHLKPQEFNLALFLFRHAGTTHSRQALAKALWPHNPHVVKGRSLDVHMSCLRRKLELNRDEGIGLHSVRGIGYRLSGSEC